MVSDVGCLFILVFGELSLFLKNEIFWILIHLIQSNKFNYRDFNTVDDLDVWILL